MEDTEDNYRAHLAALLSRTKSRGNTRYYNQFMNKCKREAAEAFPKGAAAAEKKIAATGGFIAVIATIFSIFG